MIGAGGEVGLTAVGWRGIASVAAACVLLASCKRAAEERTSSSAEATASAPPTTSAPARSETGPPTPRDSAPDAAVATAARPARVFATEDDPHRDPAGMRGFYSESGKLPKVAPPPYESPDAPCPSDMVHVQGVRCAEPTQRCLEWTPRNGKSGISCREFAAPSRCGGQRTPMNYCIDRFELTPEGYEYPLTHVNWTEAGILCKRMDKRLCHEEEWEFACEGPDAVPYPYGYVRDGARCNHDIPEIELVTKPDHFIDHRMKRDALPSCVSPFGVFNLVGNVDEWTTRRSDPRGQRAILRGGWWLQGRNRCRAATSNHGEIYAGMQTGFRCCKAARSTDR